MKNKKTKGQRLKVGSSWSNGGFSLIELVFAMFFLGIIILGVVNLQSSNLAMMNRQNNQIQAHLIANESIQILKGMGYGYLNTIKPPGTCQAAPCYFIRRNNRYEMVQQKEEPLNNLFLRSVQIDSDGLTKAFKATVYIEWTDSTGEHLRKNNAHVEAKTIIF